MALLYSHFVINPVTFPESSEDERERARDLLQKTEEFDGQRFAIGFGRQYSNNTAPGTYGKALTEALREAFESTSGGKAALLAGLQFTRQTEMRKLIHEKEMEIWRLRRQTPPVAPARNGVHGTYPGQQGQPVRIFSHPPGKVVVQHLGNLSDIRIVDEADASELTKKRRMSSCKRPE
jgi:hypothetical protein